MKDIADYLKITPPYTTTIIEEMERKGLVERIKDEKRFLHQFVNKKN